MFRTQEEAKVLAPARKFTNNKERKNRLQRVGQDRVTEQTQRKNKENTVRERWTTPRESNGPGGLGYRVFKARLFA